MAYSERYRDDDDDDEKIDEDEFPCYGKSWRLGDTECRNCEIENDCRKMQFARAAGKYPEKRRTRAEPFISSTPVRKYEFPTNYEPKYGREPVDIMVPLPNEDEPIGMRLLKNIMFGLLSRLGWEFWRFFDQVSRRW